jgi:hypothetical protein
MVEPTLLGWDVQVRVLTRSQAWTGRAAGRVSKGLGEQFA